MRGEKTKKTCDALKGLSGRCMGCGVCVTLCPVKCISIKRKGYNYKISIDDKNCIDCGLCIDICPLINLDYASLIQDTTQLDYSIGSIEKAYVTWAKDKSIRNNGASGGSVTQLLLELLRTKRVETVSIVCMESPEKQQAKMVLTQSKKQIVEASGSSYVYVNISEIINYLLHNKQPRIAIVGLPCQLYPVCKLINKRNIPRDSIFLIGLMCSKSLNYRIFGFYRYKYHLKKLEHVTFRYKGEKGAPGCVLLKDIHGTEVMATTEERRALAQIYRNRQCLFCADKNNILSDITAGDCFIDGYSTSSGETTLLVRNEKGREMLELIDPLIEMRPLPLQAFIDYGQPKSSSRDAGCFIGLYPKYEGFFFSWKQCVKLYLSMAKNIVLQTLPFCFIRIVVQYLIHKRASKTHVN